MIFKFNRLEDFIPEMGMHPRDMGQMEMQQMHKFPPTMLKKRDMKNFSKEMDPGMGYIEEVQKSNVR